MNDSDYLQHIAKQDAYIEELQKEIAILKGQLIKDRPKCDGKVHVINSDISDRCLDCGEAVF
jgi:hypothetical protein